MIAPRWKKVVRDLFENKARTILVILAIAVGVFSFGSMYITQDVLLADMSNQYKAIKPSTITLHGTAFGEDTVKWLMSQDGIVETQGKTVQSAKLITPQKTYNISLNSYKDFNGLKINQLITEKGNWPPKNGEIILERTVVNLLKINNGDQVNLEVENGKNKTLYYYGKIHDLNAIPANLFPQLTGYVSQQTLEDLGFSSKYNQIEILTSDKYKTKKELEVYAQNLKDKLTDKGIAVGGAEIREPNKHWGEDNSKAFTAILSIIGTFSLILSGFLVINTIGAILTQQRRQIGVMKMVGGVNSQIIVLYLILVGIYGLLGLIVAVPIALGLSYVFLVAVTGFLNLDIVNFHLPINVLLMETTAAVLVPMIAGLIPIIGGIRLPVVQALNNSSVVQTVKHSLIYRLISKIRGLPRPILLSLRNTFQRQGRLWLTIGTLTIAGTLFMSVVNTRSSLMSELYNILTMFAYDVDLGLDKDYDVSTLKNEIQTFNGTDKVETRSGLVGQLIKNDNSKGVFINFIGLPYDSQMVKPTMLSGRWLSKTDKNQIVVSSPLAKNNPELKTGNMMTIETNNRKYSFEIVGVVSMVGDQLAYVNFDYLSQVKDKPNVASSVLLTVTPDQKNNLAKFADDLREKLKKEDINVAQFMTIDTIISTNEGQFNFLIGFLMAMAVMVAIVGGLGLAGTMSLNVMERTREIGVLRSIGATNKSLRGIVMTEGIIIGMTSAILAIPLSVPGSIGFSYALGQAFFERPMSTSYNLWGILIWFVLVLIISISASVIPANKAAKMSIREILSYE